MLTINTIEFRAHVGEYFDKADTEGLVAIQRGKDKAYALIPITEEGISLTPAQLEELTSFLTKMKSEKIKKIPLKNKIRNTRKIKAVVDLDNDLYMQME